MSDKTLGQVGFDAYGDEAEWKAFDGRPMPRWDDNLRADIKAKWEIAASAIAEQAVRDYIDERAKAFKEGVISKEDLLAIFGAEKV